jgi:hypothetical protein
MVLMPIGGLATAAAVWWFERPEALSVVWAAAGGAGVVFGTWALARELAPDDQRAAFVAMAFGFATSLLVVGASLSLLFAALFLARVVNRTVGPPATVVDAVSVLALVGWAAITMQSPDLWLAAALALALDAHLPGGRRRQWAFAAACLILMVGQLVYPPTITTGRAEIVAGAGSSGMAGIVWPLPIAAVFVASILRTRSLHSVADVTGAPLSALRVRAGMIVVLLVTARSLLHGDEGVTHSVLLWSVLGGVTLSDLLPGRRLPREHAWSRPPPPE